MVEDRGRGLGGKWEGGRRASAGEGLGREDGEKRATG